MTKECNDVKSINKSFQELTLVFNQNSFIGSKRTTDALFIMFVCCGCLRPQSQSSFIGNVKVFHWHLGCSGVRNHTLFLWASIVRAEPISSPLKVKHKNALYASCQTNWNHLCWVLISYSLLYYTHTCINELIFWV